MGPKPRRVSKGTEQSDQVFDHIHHSPAQSSASAQTQPQPLSTLPPTLRPTGSLSSFRPGDLSRQADLSRRRPVVSPLFSSPRPADNAAARHLDFGAPSLQPSSFQAPSFRGPPFVPQSTGPPSTRPHSTGHRPIRPIRPPASASQHTHESQPTHVSQPTHMSERTHMSQPTPTQSQSTPADPTPSQTTPVPDGDARTGEASTSTTPPVRELDPSGLW